MQPRSSGVTNFSQKVLRGSGSVGVRRVSPDPCKTSEALVITDFFTLYICIYSHLHEILITLNFRVKSKKIPFLCVTLYPRESTGDGVATRVCLVHRHPQALASQHAKALPFRLPEALESLALKRLLKITYMYDPLPPVTSGSAQRVTPQSYRTSSVWQKGTAKTRAGRQKRDFLKITKWQHWC